MNIEVQQHGHVSVVTLHGRFVTQDGDVALRGSIDRLLADDRTQILLDLGDVQYMDSSSIGEMVASYRKTSDAGGTLKLLDCPSKVVRLLHMTRLDRVFELFDDRQQAIDSFDAGAGEAG